MCFTRCSWIVYEILSEHTVLVLGLDMMSCRKCVRWSRWEGRALCVMFLVSVPPLSFFFVTGCICMHECRAQQFRAGRQGLTYQSVLIFSVFTPVTLWAVAN